MDNKVIIIGAGAAGMMCACLLSEKGIKTEVYEKNDKPGKKLFITGKGRCNLTNASDMDTVLNNIVTNRKFMYSALSSFSNEDVMEYFRKLGLSMKVERGNRVFPTSDHSSDVIAALVHEMNSNRVSLHLNTQVNSLIPDMHGRCAGVVLKNGEKKEAGAVVVATGGLSYPSTGSTGDGYRFASESGIAVTDTSPSLVPMNIREKICGEMQGLSLKNVSVSITAGKKTLYSDFGEMMFTHFGVTGPVILSASGAIPFRYFSENPILRIDFKPALSEEQLDKRVLRDFGENENREFKNALSGLFPQKLIPVMVKMSGIQSDKKVNLITRDERIRFVKLIKNFELTVSGLRGFDEAIITKGGVSVKEIDPRSFCSKKVSNLYFIGETVDVDALTGGYNLQLAWSSAAAAANSIADLISGKGCD